MSGKWLPGGITGHLKDLKKKKKKTKHLENRKRPKDSETKLIATKGETW